MGGLASAILLPEHRGGWLLEFLFAVVTVIAIALVVVALADLNGSRLLRSVLNHRQVAETYEVDRVDGNESDLRVLGLTGPGLDRRFVVVAATEGLEFWTDQQGRRSVLTPWPDVANVYVVSVPSDFGMLRPTVDLVEVTITGYQETVTLDLRPHASSNRRAVTARLRDALVEKARSEPV